MRHLRKQDVLGEPFPSKHCYPMAVKEIQGLSDLEVSSELLYFHH